MLVPTAVEAGALDSPGAALELCGFGLAAAGVGAMAAIGRHRPARVVLAGVAGTYDAAVAPVGSVVVPRQVRCVGIGAGDESAADLGFADGDVAALDGEHGLALSVASAAASLAEARERHAMFPEALLEEMEGYAVALAAMTMSIPCTMVRGICNLAGERDHAAWRMDAALEAVQLRLDTILRG